MSEAKHTSGPWRVEVDTGPEAAWERKWPTIHAAKYEVVGCDGLYGDYETDMANARLIAAAPDLLDTLNIIQEQCKSMASSDWRKWEELAYPDEFERWVKSRATHMAQQASAAIAKATKVQT